MQNSSHDYNALELAIEKVCIINMDVIIFIHNPKDS